MGRGAAAAAYGTHRRPWDHSLSVKVRSRPAVVAALVLAGCGGSTAPPPPHELARFGPDRIRYRLDLTHRGHRLAGTQRIAFRNPSTRPLTHVWLRAWDNAFGHHVDVTATAGGRVAARRRKGTAIRIDLAKPVAPGKRGAVALRIAVTTPRKFDRFGRLKGIDVLGNALPVLAVSDHGAEPLLPPYSFAGESFFSLAADWTVHLRTAPGERVASTGTRTGPDRYTAHQERDFTLVIGPMREIETTADGIRVRWFSPRRPSRAGLRMTAEALSGLQRMLGPYGARELDVLEVPPHIVNGGIAMEYPQLILSPAFRPAVSHEVAHQWFYRLVGDDEWSSPWLDETLAEFAAVRLGRRIHGPDRLRGCATRDRPAKPPAPLDSSMGELARYPRRAGVRTLYIEGPCMLFDLQRRVGKRRMDAFLRRLVATHRNGVLTTPELRSALRRLAHP